MRGPRWFTTKVLSLNLRPTLAALSRAAAAVHRERGQPRSAAATMDKWPKGKQYAAPDFANVTDAFAGLYSMKVAALEKAVLFDEFATAVKTPAEMKAKPMVFLLGQYSVGKTTFIRYLLGKDFPGMLVGPEPTTEAFTAVCRSPNGVDTSVPGSSAIADTSRPWGSLDAHGDGFAQRFCCSNVTGGSDVLDDVDLVDSPGVLAGAKQTMDRKYDFERVAQWFAERADLILVLLDTSKLDLSDEFMGLLRALQVYDDKIRIVLNKADQVSNPELLRVMQAASWNLAKTLRTPEVKRTYVSSFADETHPLRESPLKAHFEEERALLLKDLADLKVGKKQRRVNEFIRRTRHAAHHAQIVAHLKGACPLVAGKADWEKRTLDALPMEWEKIAVKRKMPSHELPSPLQYRKIFASNAVSLLSLPANCAKHAAALDAILDVDVKNTLEHFRHELDNVPFKHNPPAPTRGFLLKAGDSKKTVMGVGSGFRKRFCIIDENGVLKYYEKDPASAPNPMEVEAKGVIDLAGAKTTPLPQQHQSFCFAVEGPLCDRKYVLAATSGDEMSKWMRLVDSFGAHVDPASRKAAPTPVAAPPPAAEEEDDDAATEDAAPGDDDQEV